MSGAAFPTATAHAARALKALPDDLVFVTSIYGTAYLPFLAPHMFSVARAHPQATHLVLWEDLPAHEIEILSQAFACARFVRIEADMTGTLIERLRKKVGCWKQACQLYPAQPLCFIDVDALIVRPIYAFIPRKVDAVYTWKDEVFSLNLGVLLVRNGDVGLPIFEEWAERTNRIVRDPAALRNALIASGDASQHAFREMIGFVNYDSCLTRQIRDRSLVFQGIPCALLNETQSVPITEKTHVVHYKTGWHPILLEGAGFSAYRSEAASADMLRFWREIAGQAHAHVARSFVVASCAANVEKFKKILGPYEERGVLHSEMLAVCAVCDSLNIDVIIESGRCRGQSTFMLGRYFSRRPTRIISVELIRNEDALIAEQRVASFENVKLYYGNSRRVIPRLMRKLQGKRCALLLDGPKGQPAAEIAAACLKAFPNLAAVFFHDAKPSAPIRALVAARFSRCYFTDNQEYVDAYAFLDESCKPSPDAAITLHTWRPYYKGHAPIESYGPTLAVVLPIAGERVLTGAALRSQSGGVLGKWREYAQVVKIEGPRSALRRAIERLTCKI